MNVVLLRVGIDTGCGGISGPLFRDGSFEFICIPDAHRADPRTYGNTLARCGRKIIDFFPPARRVKMHDQSMHVDPEFQTYTYGDPTQGAKRGLRKLQLGDLLVFYAGLRGYDFECASALYIVGYFEVTLAGLASRFDPSLIDREFGANFHVRNQELFKLQRESLLLVKGGSGSRLLKKAFPISQIGANRSGRPLQILSNEMRQVFGEFGGKHAIERSSPRWVEQTSVSTAATFIRSLD